MKHLRTVDDVMTHAVISVNRRAPFEDIVETMRRWRISVSGGIAHLHGSIPDPSLDDVLIRIARTVPGVVDVTARLDAEVPV
ncbi:hypothetical protein [Streptomyces sp. NBC_00057]|uniref:hypothetical protein n=1 Tax=Streptomyces sp. NBC_00057 TaxID=2975634 RepID=UPI0032554A71